MGKRVRSAKGEMVDFDFLKIKEQLASAPTPIEVRKRQDFIEDRSKRRLKKSVATVEKVEVEPKLPEPLVELEQSLKVETPEVEELVDEKDEKENPKTKQRARKKK